MSAPAPAPAGGKKDNQQRPKYGKPDQTGNITAKILPDKEKNTFLTFSNPSDLMYFNIRNSEYVFNEPVPANSDPTPKITFVLFYTKDREDEDEDDTTTKPANKPKERDPPIVNIINLNNIDDILKDNGIALVKINNLAIEPVKDKDKANIPLQPKFLIEAFQKIWDTDYHPYYWFRNRPRILGQDGETDISKNDKFYKDKDGKPIDNPTGKPLTWRSSFLPVIVIYKGGFPVMMYEGPYGNQFSEDETEKQERENKLVSKLFIKFLERLGIEDKYRRKTDFTRLEPKVEIVDFSPNVRIPDVLQKETWDNIAKELWFEYYQETESITRDVSGYSSYLTSVGVPVNDPSVPRAILPPPNRLPAVPFVPAKKPKKKSLYQEYLDSTYPDEESSSDEDLSYPDLKIDNDVLFVPSLRPKGYKQPKSDNPEKLSTNITANMKQILTIPKFVSSPYAMLPEPEYNTLKIAGMPKLRGANKSFAETKPQPKEETKEETKEEVKPQQKPPNQQRPPQGKS